MSLVAAMAGTIETPKKRGKMSQKHVMMFRCSFSLACLAGKKHLRTVTGRQGHLKKPSFQLPSFCSELPEGGAKVHGDAGSRAPKQTPDPNPQRTMARHQAACFHGGLRIDGVQGHDTK